MDEPTDAQCRKCGAVFTTRASTRTHCPACRAAVTVRRNGSASQAGTDYGGESGGNLAAGLAAIVGLAIVIGSWFWRGWWGTGHDS
jgi:hypothetical protein